MDRLTQPLSRTRLIHHGALGEREKERDRQTHTHTHTHTDRDRDRERERDVHKQGYMDARHMT